MQRFCRTLSGTRRFLHSRRALTSASQSLPVDRSQLAQPLYPSFKLAQPTTIDCFVQRYQNQLEPAQKLKDSSYNIAGRIIARRDSSSKLIFFMLEGDNCVQVVASKERFADQVWNILQDDIRIGDIIYFSGFPGKTKTGEMSLFANDCKLLTPCLHNPPFKHQLRDPEKRIRSRFLDLMVNRDLRSRLILRSKIISLIRLLLSSRGFLEIETPVLLTQAGGANARPFVTTAHAYGMEMHLRIAPELYLKQLVIGGFDRVFEIGKQFRNEGIDSNHNPEFTTCEFYQAYANLENLMTTTESILCSIVQEVKEENAIVSCISKNGQPVDVNFTPPYRRIMIIPALEQKLNTKLPDLNAHDSAEELVTLCKEKGIPLPSYPHTTARLLDQLVSELLEPDCIQPTFLCGHPTALSPLSKADTDKNVAARFELFAAGQELVNAYEELNDPTEQRQRFLLQQQNRDSGDMEAHVADEQFCEALEYGLPPTGGWGLGIDRFCMLLSGVHNIREVISFPTIRPISMAKSGNN